jgi:hypothetical protein
MNSTVATIRELSIEEAAVVSGAWTWEGLAGAMITGGVVGGMGGALTGAGIPLGALTGSLLAGTGYLINDWMMWCF